MNLLATISATAPWLGLYCTVGGINRALGGTSGDKTSIMAAIAGCLSEALLLAALGLATALIAWAAREQCHSTIAAFDVEMRAATLDLLNRLAQPPNTA